MLVTNHDLLAKHECLCSSCSNWTARGLEAVPPCHYVQLLLEEVEVAVLVEELLLLPHLLTLALGEALVGTGGFREASAPPAATSPGEGAQVRELAYLQKIPLPADHEEVIAECSLKYTISLSQSDPLKKSPRQKWPIAI